MSSLDSDPFPPSDGCPACVGRGATTDGQPVVYPVTPYHFEAGETSVMCWYRCGCGHGWSTSWRNRWGGTDRWWTSAGARRGVSGGTSTATGDAA